MLCPITFSVTGALDRKPGAAGTGATAPAMGGRREAALKMSSLEASCEIRWGVLQMCSRKSEADLRGGSVPPKESQRAVSTARSAAAGVLISHS
jgi:hypothetical protein